MAIEADEPRPRAGGHLLGEDLSALSIDELQRRVALLRAEIERLQAAIEAKSAHRNAAASLFKL